LAVVLAIGCSRKDASGQKATGKDAKGNAQQDPKDHFG
jgi:hypothetical protein